MESNIAHELTLIAQKQIEEQRSEVKEALKEVMKAAKSGEMNCRYDDDDVARKGLQLLGYTVSDMWKESGWYRTEYMTISWDK